MIPGSTRGAMPQRRFEFTCFGSAIRGSRAQGVDKMFTKKRRRPGPMRLKNMHAYGKTTRELNGHEGTLIMRRETNSQRKARPCKKFQCSYIRPRMDEGSADSSAQRDHNSFIREIRVERHHTQWKHRLKRMRS